jgi:hypothetical protein
MNTIYYELQALIFICNGTEAHFVSATSGHLSGLGVYRRSPVYYVLFPLWEIASLTRDQASWITRLATEVEFIYSSTIAHNFTLFLLIIVYLTVHSRHISRFFLKAEAEVPHRVAPLTSTIAPTSMSVANRMDRNDSERKLQDTCGCFSFFFFLNPFYSGIQAQG